MEPRFRRGRRRSPRRSRSPRYEREHQNQQNESISKALVCFGRYERNRPKGLIVNRDGGFMLNNLMDCWARAQGYRRQDVLDAVRVHMFHEDGYSLRFEITAPRGQDTMIKVKPRRGGGRDRFPEDRPPPRRRGGSLNEDSVKEDSDREDSLPPPPRSLEDKLDMTLDELVSPSNRSAASSSREPFAHREARVHCKMEQMGHTVQSAHRRRPPMAEDRPGSADRSPPRPRVKKPPVPMPLGKAFVKAAPAKPPPLVKPPVVKPPAIPVVKVESQAMDVDRPLEPPANHLEDLSDEGFEEEEEMPDPPPGDGWLEYEDDGNSWWYYDGPKGKFCCLGPGHEIRRMDD